MFQCSFDGVPCSLLQHVMIGQAPKRGLGSQLGTASPHQIRNRRAASSRPVWPSVVFDTLHDEQCSVHRTGSVSSSTEKGIALTSQIGSRTKDTPGMVYYGSLTHFMPLVRATRPQERAPSRIR